LLLLRQGDAGHPCGACLCQLNWKTLQHRFDGSRSASYPSVCLAANPTCLPSRRLCRRICRQPAWHSSSLWQPVEILLRVAGASDCVLQPRPHLRFCFQRTTEPKVSVRTATVVAAIHSGSSRRQPCCSGGGRSVSDPGQRPVAASDHRSRSRTLAGR